MNVSLVNQSDLDWITDKLKEEELCYDDLDSPSITLWKLEDANPQGFFGLEICQNDAILRSVVVLENVRSKGIGTQMVAHALEVAKNQGIKNVYLLTLSAQNFFSKFDFVVIDRKTVPDAIRNTREFATFCPDTAICMVKTL